MYHHHWTLIPRGTPTKSDVISAQQGTVTYHYDRDASSHISNYRYGRLLLGHHH